MYTCNRLFGPDPGSQTGFAPSHSQRYGSGCKDELAGWEKDEIPQWLQLLPAHGHPRRTLRGLGMDQWCIQSVRSGQQGPRANLWKSGSTIKTDPKPPLINWSRKDPA